MGCSIRKSSTCDRKYASPLGKTEPISKMGFICTLKLLAKIRKQTWKRKWERWENFIMFAFLIHVQLFLCFYPLEYGTGPMFLFNNRYVMGPCRDIMHVLRTLYFLSYKHWKKKPLEAFIKGKAWLNLLQNLKEHSPQSTQNGLEDQVCLCCWIGLFPCFFLALNAMILRWESQNSLFFLYTSLMSLTKSSIL